MEEDKFTCLSCSIEALLMAKTYLLESLQNRSVEDKRRKLREAVRELKHAELHLISKYPEQAGKIRDLRKSFEPCIFLPEEDRCKFEGLRKVINELEDKIEEVNKLGSMPLEPFETINNNFYKLVSENNKIDINTKTIKQIEGKEGGRNMAIKHGGTIAGILGAQVGGIFVGKAVDYVLRNAQPEDTPAYKKYSEWTKAGLGLVSALYGVFAAPAAYDIPLTIFGGQLLTQSAVVMGESMIKEVAPPAAGTRYRLVSRPAPITSAPISSASIVGATPSVGQLGGKVRDMTGGI